MNEIIVLNDSDDDVVEDTSHTAGGSVIIGQATPLDLNALLSGGGGGVGGGPIMPARLNGYGGGHHGTAQQRILPRPHTHQPLPYQRPVATVRLAANHHYNNNGHRVIVPSQRHDQPGAGNQHQRHHTTNVYPAIRSSTAVTHTTSYQPLPRHSLPANQNIRPAASAAALQNGTHNGSMNGPQPMRNGGPSAAAGESETLKLRLQISNGAYQRMPNSKPVSPVSEQRAKNYAFDCERPKYAKMGTPDGVMTSHRFRCSYNNCNALIYGNVNFMNHVWSHLAVWKPTEDEINDRGKTDVDALSTCPQCMARFENPHFMQLHYTRAHSRLKLAIIANTCGICEKEVTSLRHHLTIHDPTDAPYKCPSCTYKTNIRMHLYDHFCRRHANHTTLMCPFCSFFKTVEVPQSKHKKRVQTLKCRDYVSHLKKHELSDRGVRHLPSEVRGMVTFNSKEADDNRRRLACDRCACCFVKSEDRVIHVHEHQKDLHPKYVTRQRGLKGIDTRDRRESELVLLAVGELSMCKECKQLEPSQRDKRCLMCARLVWSIDAIAGKNIAYSDNVPRSSVAFLSTAPVVRGRCSCKFECENGNLLAAHFYTCRRTMRVLLKGKKGKKEDGDGDEEEEEKEKEEEEEKEKKEVKEQSVEDEQQEREEEDLFALEKESTPADLEAQRETIRALQAELHAAVVARIKNRDLPATPAPRRTKKGAPIPAYVDPDASEFLEERASQIKVKPEAMTFRIRITRNNYAESESRFKELMAKRDEED